MPGYHASALPDRWELRDPSGRLVAAGRAAGIADALRWIAAVSPCAVERYEATEKISGIILHNSSRETNIGTSRG
jgi:hypothetical protein